MVQMNHKEFLVNPYPSDLNRIKNKQVTIIFSHFMKIDYLVFFSYIIKKLCDAGCTVTVVDVSHVETNNEEDKWGASRVAMLQFFYSHIIAHNQNVVALSLQPLHFNSALKKTILIRTRGTKLLSEFLDVVSSQFSHQISIGIQSYFATHETKSIDTSIRLNKRQKNKCIGIIMEALAFEAQLRSILSGSEILIVQNGRWRAQPFYRQLGQECGNRVLFLNNGGSWDFHSRFVLGPFPPQDHRFYEPRESELDPFISDESINDFLDSWIETNKSRKFIEIDFKKRPPRQLNHINQSKKPFILILSSSPSEYDFFRKVHWDWKDQGDAFARAAHLAKESGLQVIVRLHPNQFNYSLRDLHALITKVKDIADKIYMPWSNISTYDLMLNSKGVLVWESTTGLEAVVLGVPSASLIDTHFSKRSGVPVLRNDLDILEWIELPILPLQKDVARAVHFLQFFGEPIQELSALNLSGLTNQLRNLNQYRPKSQGRIKQIKYILQKSRFLTELHNLTPSEVHWMVSKIGGQAIAEKVLLRLANEN